MNGGNRILTIDTVDRFLRWWPFLRTGLDYLYENVKWGLDDDTFFKALLNAATRGPKLGVLLVLVNSGGQPLGYSAIVDGTNLFEGHHAKIIALFSNQLCKTAFTELVAEMEQWAKQLNFSEVYFNSYRFSSAAQRWFRKIGFNRDHVVYIKRL